MLKVDKRNFLTKLYSGSLFIWNGQNYLINNMSLVTDKSADVKLVNANNEIISLELTQEEFFKAVVI